MLKPHRAGLENTAIPHFEIKVTEIPQEELSNIANHNVPLRSESEQILTFLAPI